MYGSPMGAAALLAFTAIWSLQVARRLPQDLATVRGSAERPEKVAVLAVWSLTGVLALVSVSGVAHAVESVLRWVP